MDVRIACLGILVRGDATGYEIKKAFEDGPCDFFVEASFGSIYPALGKLTKEGLVSVRAEARAKRPERKIYSITESGRRAFLAALSGPLPEDRFRSPFLFALSFADLLPPARIEALLDHQIAEAEARLAKLDAACVCSNSSQDFVCDFGRTMYATMLDFLKRRRGDFAPPALKAAE